MKVALTGGTSGIGAAVAAELTAKGHSVTVFDIHEPQANADHWIRVDLSDFAAVDAAIEAADGPFDALINNAGLPPRDGLAETGLAGEFLWTATVYARYDSTPSARGFHRKRRVSRRIVLA